MMTMMVMLVMMMMMMVMVKDENDGGGSVDDDQHAKVSMYINFKHIYIAIYIYISTYIYMFVYVCMWLYPYVSYPIFTSCWSTILHCVLLCLIIPYWARYNGHGTVS